MLHGLLTGSMATWYFTAPTLAETHSYTCSTFGDTDEAKGVSGYDTKTMGADLEALVSLNGETPIDLVGHSYGALVHCIYSEVPGQSTPSCSC